MTEKEKDMVRETDMAKQETDLDRENEIDNMRETETKRYGQRQTDMEKRKPEIEMKGWS